MNRLPRPAAIAAIVLAVSVLGACGYVRPPAVTIAVDQSSAPFFTFSADELFAELEKDSGGGEGTTTKPASVPADRIAELLTSKVRPRILQQVLAERNVVPTDEDRAVVEQASQQQQSPPSEEEREFQTNFYALARALADDFFARPGNNIDEYARRYYDQRQASFAQPAQTCLHVLTVDAGDGRSRPTDEQYAQALPQAQALRQRLDSEPFEQVFEASGASTQGLPGGNLGCRPEENLPSELVPEMAPVPVGSVSQPIRWRAGWVIVRIDERRAARTPPFEEIRNQVQTVTRQSFGQQFVNEVLSRANRSFVVEVDPRFGEWNAEQGQVTRPGAAAVPTTPTTSTTMPPLDEGVPEPTAPGATTPPVAATDPAAAPTTTSAG